jgi:hypothetical protein
MIYIQYQILNNKEESIFWIKPLWCPIKRPFCIVRWNRKQDISICPFYCGIRGKSYGKNRIECGCDEELESQALGGVSENCPSCMHYLGSVCTYYGEFRDPCDSFFDEEKFFIETAKRLHED